MKIRVLLAVVLGAAALGGSGVAADGEEIDVPEGDGCPPHTLSKARGIVKEAWDREGWRQENPVKKTQVRELGYLRGCLSGNSKKKLAAYAGKQKVQFYRHRAYRQVAPYSGFSNCGYWLRWLAIPASVVAGEGGCDWNVRNYAGSGACGPYQFIGWTSCDTSSWRDKLRHHRTAAYVLRVQGPGAWEAW